MKLQVGLGSTVWGSIGFGPGVWGLHRFSSFRVQDLGIRALGLGFGDWGVRDLDLGFTVWGLLRFVVVVDEIRAWGVQFLRLVLQGRVPTLSF